MTRRACAAAARHLIASLAGAVLLATPAGAHAVLVRSTPPGRATLAEKPDRVQLWFNERLEPAFSSVSVWSSAGTQVDAGDARVGPEDAKRLSGDAPAAAARRLQRPLPRPLGGRPRGRLQLLVHDPPLERR
jgi:methionine-rich copper-binding protein CopC